MESTGKDDKFLTRYQNLLFNPKLQSGTPSEKADVLRNVLAHLHCVQVSDKRDDSGVEEIQHDYEDMYTNIVDSFDEETGLNNFAEGALSLCRGNKNESQSWKSSLTLEKIKSMPYVQQAALQSKKCSLLGRRRPDELLPLSTSSCNKENSVSSSNHSNLSTAGRDVSNLSTAGRDASNLSTAGRDVRSAPDKVMNLYTTTPQSAVNQYGHGAIQQSEQVRNFSRNSGSAGLRGESHAESRVGPPVNRQPLFSTGRGLYEPAAGPRPREPVQKRGYNQSCDEEEETRTNQHVNVFKTAKQQLDIDYQRKYGGAQSRAPVNNAAYGNVKKSLGTRRGLNSKFVPPVMNREEEELSNEAVSTITRAVLKTGDKAGSMCNMEGIDEEKLKGIEPKMVELIMNEIMDNGPPMTWDDVAGLEFAKKTIKEIVVWPMLRPDIFTGLRGPPKGLLLFGPPGTGKTLIGKCIASQSKSTFFCISASSLTSKWVGEGEKMVRALFAVARARQPAVVFIDEIDSLLTQRTDGENEASRRIKTEFLVQLDGASTSSEDRLLVIGATNRPQEIDEAARRRFVKRLYIPLPETTARKTIITNLLKQQSYQLTDTQLDTICSHTDGYSGADMSTLCREAALGPIRDMSFGDIENISADQVRPITYQDFEDALKNVKPSVSDKDLDVYIEWNNTFGSGGR